MPDSAPFASDDALHALRTNRATQAALSFCQRLFGSIALLDFPETGKRFRWRQFDHRQARCPTDLFKRFYNDVLRPGLGGLPACAQVEAAQEAVDRLTGFNASADGFDYRSWAENSI